MHENSRYKPEDFEFEGELANPLLLTNIYERGFDYAFTLTAFNEISDEIRSFNFTVNNEPCKAPVLKIRNQVLDVNNASFWYRNKAVELYTFTGSFDMHQSRSRQTKRSLSSVMFSHRRMSLSRVPLEPL